MKTDFYKIQSLPVDKLVEYLAKEHISPLGRKCEYISSKRVNDSLFSVVFEFDGNKQEQLVLSSPYLLSLDSCIKASNLYELKEAVLAALPELKAFENILASSLSADSRSDDGDRKLRKKIAKIIDLAEKLQN